jgi:hypothetical protein
MAMYNPWYTYCSFCKVHRQGVSYLGFYQRPVLLLMQTQGVSNASDLANPFISLRCHCFSFIKRQLTLSLANSNEENDN